MLGTGAPQARSTLSTGESTHSGRVSPAPPPAPSRGNSLPNTSAGRAHRPSTPSGPPVFRTLDSYSARNVAAAMEGGVDKLDDVWQSICVRVLPLFNGEGYRGYVEDLNELVSTYVQRTLSRAKAPAKSRSQNPASSDTSALATGLIMADLTELVAIGCMNLEASLLDLWGHQLLLRLNELWSFFWTKVLPNLEAVFVFLHSDERLVNPSISGDIGSRLKIPAGIDVRKLALIGFRDALIIPRIDHLASLFHDLYTSPLSSQEIPRGETPPPMPTTSAPSPTPSRPRNQLFSSTSTVIPPLSPAIPSPIPFPTTPPFAATASRTSSVHDSPRSSAPIYSALATEQSSNALRRQLVSVLASVMTGDDRQLEMDSLLRTMRLGSQAERPLSRAWSNREHAEASFQEAEAPYHHDGVYTNTPLSEDISQFASPVMRSNTTPTRKPPVRSNSLNSFDLDAQKAGVEGGDVRARQEMDFGLKSALIEPQSTLNTGGRRKGFMPRFRRHVKPSPDGSTTSTTRTPSKAEEVRNE